MQITSRGEHLSSNRIYSLIVKQSSGDTSMSEEFEGDDNVAYSPYGAGPGP